MRTQNINKENELDRVNIKDIKKYEKACSHSQADFISVQSNCVLCASDLDISVKSVETDNTICEEAYCPQCKLRLRSKNHSLN